MKYRVEFVISAGRRRLVLAYAAEEGEEPWGSVLLNGHPATSQLPPRRLKVDGSPDLDVRAFDTSATGAEGLSDGALVEVVLASAREHQ